MTEQSVAEQATYSPTPWSARWMNKPATPKAVGFAKRLFAERKVEAETAAKMGVVLTAPLPNAGDVSYIIEALLQQAKKPAPGQPTETGFYVVENTVYRVQQSKSSGNLYAKVLQVSGPEGNTRGSWVYAPGAMRKLVGAEKLTAAAAAEMGHVHGWCVRCCASLEDTRSVVAGYGETCAKRMGWSYPTKAEAEAALAASAAAEVAPEPEVEPSSSNCGKPGGCEAHDGECAPHGAAAVARYSCPDGCCWTEYDAAGVLVGAC